jgi:hypothetical protein
MTDYRLAKRAFLEWLQEQGIQRGYDPSLRLGDMIILERPRLLARTRGSVCQEGNITLRFNDEMNYDGTDFKRVFSIILDLHSRRAWNPGIDDFYPLSLILIETLEKESRTTTNTLALDLDDKRIQKQKNNLQALFPVDGEVETIEAPANRIEDDRIGRLNKLANELVS